MSDTLMYPLRFDEDRGYILDAEGKIVCYARSAAPVSWMNQIVSVMNALDDEDAPKSETSTPSDEVIATLRRVRDSLGGSGAWAGAQKCLMAVLALKNAAPQAQAEGVALHGGSSPQPAVAATASPYDVSGNPTKEYPGE